jgi:TonB family protein
MIADILAGLARANLAAGAAVLLVLLLRRPVRAAFGARVAYVLWIAVPLAAAAALAPQPQAPTVLSPIVLSVADAAGASFAASRAGGGAALTALFCLWLVGALAAATLLTLRQARFTTALGRLRRAAGGTFQAEHAGVGPAVVGVFRPKIVTPADFEARFAAEERGLILAHEGVHLARGDVRINAAAALAQCLAWFNPLAHLAVHRMRIDQELACDAAVLSKAPRLRRLYAEVLLKTQMASQPLPLGCQWPPTSDHPLKERIIMLKSPPPARTRSALGLAAVTAVSLAGACAAWAAQPVAAPGPLIVAPDWAQRPTGEDLKWAYPPAALAERLEGRATLACGVDAGGRLIGCTVASEAPAAAGFGQAALALSPSFQMKPLSKDGVATGGGAVRIPIRFMPANPAPPQP